MLTVGEFEALGVIFINGDICIDSDDGYLYGGEGCSARWVVRVNTGEDEFECEAFGFSRYGGCGYYPSGGYSINILLFTPI